MQSGPSCQQHGRYCNAFRTTPGVVPRPHAWKRRPRHQTRTESRGRAPSARSLSSFNTAYRPYNSKKGVCPRWRGAHHLPASLLLRFLRLLLALVSSVVLDHTISLALRQRWQNSLGRGFVPRPVLFDSRADIRFSHNSFENPTHGTRRPLIGKPKRPNAGAHTRSTPRRMYR